MAGRILAGGGRHREGGGGEGGSGEDGNGEGNGGALRPAASRRSLLPAYLLPTHTPPFHASPSRFSFECVGSGGCEQAVCKAGGTCKRTKLLARKGQRNPDKSTERLLIPELLSDIVHAVKKTSGCVNFIRVQEELERLGEPMGGAVTRWGYWTLVCKWLAPTTGRFELIITFLLHKWLQAQGDDGIALASSEDDKPTLSGDALLEKVQTLKDAARRGLLLEMLNPEVRVWLCFLDIYGERSAQRFIKFTENDDAVSTQLRPHAAERLGPASPAPRPLIPECALLASLGRAPLSRLGVSFARSSRT